MSKELNDGLTHFVGDTCEGGHRPTNPFDAIAMLKREFSLSPTMPTGGISVLPSVALDLCDELTRAYHRLERMEAVVAEARRLVPGAFAFLYQSPYANRYELLRSALAALDGLQNRSDTGTDTQSAQVVSGDENKSTHHNLRPCPNAVSWCGGPDRYEDICAACLATWTEETKEKK